MSLRTVALLLLLLLTSGFNAEAGTPKIDIVDFLVDFDQYAGQDVILSGVLLTAGDTMILYQSRGSTNGVFVDPSSLSPDQHKFLLTKCGDGCNATLEGEAGTVMLNKGLVATKIIAPKYEPPPKGKPAAKVKREFITVPDLIAEYEGLDGEELIVKGYLMAMGETLILYEKPGSLNSVFVNGDALDRDALRSILRKCGSGCSIKLKGQIGEVMSQKGFIAIDVVREKK